MAHVAYENALGGTTTNWQRIRITTNRGRVAEFTVQYEIDLNARRVAVIRYDSAHGFPHLDVLNRRGKVVAKMPLPGEPTLGEALQIGIDDLRYNWQTHRRRFLGEEP